MDDLSLRTMHVFVSKALTRIVDECGRRPSELRTACTQVLEQTKDGRLEGGSSAGSGLNVAAVYFGPLHLACESGNPRIMEAALSCVQKLIAYGFVTATTPALPAPAGARRDTRPPDNEGDRSTHGGGTPGQGASLSTRIVEVVCACKDEEDEAVQLQVVKAALTAVTAPSAGVHDTSLLLAVKTCVCRYPVSH
ncbi:hypothetical protein T492DRAFT_193137 [Pavlovales sp. CCMP2436]|nr:hypothetical protein T492DRAFT_193137 [Pavlovales sp. CCMP2436]